MNNIYESNLIHSNYKYPINLRGSKSLDLNYYKINFNNIFLGDISYLDSIHKISLEKREKEIKHIFLNELKSDFKINPHQKYWGLDFLDFYSPEIIYLFESIIINSFPQIFFPKHLNKSKCFYSFLFEDARIQKYFDTLKIKISPCDFDDKVKIETINNFLNNKDIKNIRFDGNKKFTLNELQKFFLALDSKHLKKIEYFEDACQTLSESIEFSKITNTKMAIDESFEFESLQFLNQISELTHFTLVLRPSLFGISQSKIIIDQYAEIGIPTIISSSYETENQILGLLYLANYSDTKNKQKLFHGLDPINAIPSSNVRYMVSDNKIEIRLVDSPN